jgi:hypothetical protein
VSLARLLCQPLTVQAMGPKTKDAYGDWTPGALGAPVAVLGFLEQTASVEVLLGRDTTVTTWKVFLPAETAITPLSTIAFEGQTFQVSGAPWRAFNPRTKATSHIEAKVVVVSG